MLRSLAVIAGGAIVLAAAHVGIIASGGYEAPTAPLHFAVAVGLIVGSICVGAALREHRWPLAVVFVIALLAGEAYAIISSSDATIAARDATAAPIQNAGADYERASQRVDRAEAAKTKADDAAISEAAKPGCRRECRVLLEGAKADAQRELDTARSQLAKLPPPRSAAPLADRLKIAGSTLDLITAALRSVAINGLGAALIAFGAHHGRRREEDASSEERPRTSPAAPRLPAAEIARDHALRFSRDVLTPADAIDTPVAQLHSAYLEWCSEKGYEPLPTRVIGTELAALFKRSGLEIVEIDGTRYVARARIKHRRGVTGRAVLGPMATTVARA